MSLTRGGVTGKTEDMSSEIACAVSSAELHGSAELDGSAELIGSAELGGSAVLDQSA